MTVRPACAARRRLALCSVAACVGLPPHRVLGAADAARPVETIRVVTEELPPYNMTQGGRVTGLCTEVVEAVFQQLGLRPVIESMPWERAYETALNAPNVLIYSIDRTPHRERLFKWIGEIGPPDPNALYALAARRLTLASLDQARRYRIATVNGDSSEEYLLARGFLLGTNLVRSNKIGAGYELLRLGRVDLWATSELSAPYVARIAHDDPATTLRIALQLPGLGRPGVTMAFGARTPDALVQRFRDGLAAVQRNGTYDAIHRKWR